MMEIYNEDCRETMKRMIERGDKIDLVITSPPYNTQRGKIKYNKRNFDWYNAKYDIEMPNMTEEEYIGFVVEVFRYFEEILKRDGVILWNMSYGSDKYTPMGRNIMWLVIAELIKETGFTVADRIIWKKKSALPNNMSKNKLTRVVEDIFVFVREEEYESYYCNKKVIGKINKNQNLYTVYYNYIEAKNNDGKNPYNKATYSTELVLKLLNMYGKEGDKDFIVYDPFGGTGTTLNACKEYGVSGIMSELSSNQCNYAKERLNINE